ncbi:MAG: DUF3108 domain-containing protein [Bryobacteraceae bacterium]
MRLFFGAQAKVCATLLAGLMANSATAPKFSNEQLHYSVNWPSGLSLGEGQLSASRTKSAENGPDRLDLNFTLDAAIPGFQVQDRYHSEATADFCSALLDRTALHGKKKAEEKTTFDPEKGTAVRETKGGGKSDIQTAVCGKDALSYLYFLRHELSQGRLPPSQPVYFGSAYQVRVEFAGTQTIKLGDTSVEADRLKVSVKGSSSEINFEVFFLKDAARTPALVRVPLSLGTFAMELVR